MRGGGFLLILAVLAVFVTAHFMSDQGLGFGWLGVAVIIVAIIGFNLPGDEKPS
jgi:hypothetical protein